MDRLCDPSLQFRLISVFQDTRESTDTAAIFPRPYHALSCRLSGQATFTAREQQVTVEDNSVLYMPADTPYHLRAGAEQIIVIHFEVSAPMEKRFSALSEVSPTLRERFVALHRTWQEKAPGYELRAMSLFYGILEQLRHHIDLPQQQLYRRLRPAVERLHADFADPALSVAALAAQAKLGDTQFRRLFCQLMGKTPLDYLNALRVERAAALLDDGLLSVEEIALRCGFSDPKYFSTVFRKYKGMPPSAYRTRT